jgi:hypothetical protein
MDFLKHAKQQQQGGARKEKVSSFEIPMNFDSPSTQLMHILGDKNRVNDGVYVGECCATHR